jgi:uncharacterized membrane protein YGL010W
MGLLCALETTMRTLVDYLSTYAAYHREPRNIASHVLGIPVIVLSVFILLSRVSMDVQGIVVTPALLVFLLSSLFYLRLSIPYGVVMFVLNGFLLLTAGHFATVSFGAWLATGLGTFVLGWAIQFLGHHYEGKSPAFLQDMASLVIGPLFIVVEMSFLMGFGRPLQRQIEEAAGPLRHRDAGGDRRA